MSRSKIKETVDSDYVMEFGKWKGKAIWWIVKNDSSYLVWLVDNHILSVSDEIYAECKDSDWMDDMNAGFGGCEIDLY